jgi:hypothetical protein
MNPILHRPPQDGKKALLRQIFKASLIAVPVAIAMFFGVVHVINSQRKAVASQAGWQEVKSSGRALHDDQKKNFDPKIGITNADLARLEKMQAGLKNVSENASGDEAIVAQAISQYINRLQTAVKTYQDVAGKLRAAHVLDKFDSSDIAQIPARREIVQQFLNANGAVKQVLTNCEDRFRADLTAAKVRDLKIQDFLDVLHSALARKNAILLKIRQCDDRMGVAMLDALNTLKSERGHWKYDPNTNKIRFETAATTEAYENAIAAIEAASEEQVKLQAQLVNLPIPQP